MFHIGVVVPNLDKAMDELGAAFGYDWSTIRDVDFVDLATPNGKTSAKLRIAFASPGPPWVEVIEARDASVWSASTGAALHHLAYWVDDLEKESEHLESVGMGFELGRSDEEGRLSGFAYHLNPQGGRVELVDESGRDGLERWVTQGV
jgi:hypothetical protein